MDVLRNQRIGGRRSSQMIWSWDYDMSEAEQVATAIGVEELWAAAAPHEQQEGR